MGRRPKHWQWYWRLYHVIKSKNTSSNILKLVSLFIGHGNFLGKVTTSSLNTSCRRWNGRFFYKSVHHDKMPNIMPQCQIWPNAQFHLINASNSDVEITVVILHAPKTKPGMPKDFSTTLKMTLIQITIHQTV